MCGIAGILNRNERAVSPYVLKQMTDAIAHRGPDGEGFFVNGPLGLGHRRLAIIDLSPAGHQPMLSKDGRYSLVFNGEIYNFQELRLELENLGHRFYSRTDSEVVLKSYLQWGSSCIERFNGMFAFAIWDNQRSELFLARDRYGIKPLYYYDHGPLFLFASELKAFTAHPDFRLTIDKEGLVEYLSFQNFFTDRTLFAGVKTFPAGHCAVVTAEAAPQFYKYWDFNFEEPEKKKSEQDYSEELDHLFKQAVNRQLVSDVEIGAYLSSGMDSGSITAIAAQNFPYLKTFTVGFDLHSASGLELAYDERERAEYLSYLLKTEHYEMVLKAGDMERVLPRLVWFLEEPRVGQSYPNFYAAQLASKFCKVVLSGAGGDEIFGGYPWRYYRAVTNSNFDDYIKKYFQFWQRLIPGDRFNHVISPIYQETKHIRSEDVFRSVFGHERHHLTRPEDYVNHSLYFEARTFLHGLLIVDDKLSMAHSLEARVPFLDNDLVDFAMKLPVGMKLGNLPEVIRIDENEPGKEHKFFQRSRDGKLILRKTLSRYIPKEITECEKQGFSAPDASWFKGESIDFIKKLFFHSKALIFDYLNQREVEALINDHLEGRENRRLLIWSLLNLEVLFRHLDAKGLRNPSPTERPARKWATSPQPSGRAVAEWN